MPESYLACITGKIRVYSELILEFEKSISKCFLQKQIPKTTNPTAPGFGRSFKQVFSYSELHQGCDR